MKEIELNIKGMHCTGCSNRLEKVLNNLEGVESASVSFEEAKAFIKFDQEKQSEQRIKEAIADAGFEGDN